MTLFIASIAVLVLSLVAIAAAVVINRKIVKKQFAELSFRDELLGVLSSSTDDIYLVIAPDGYTVEFVSPNIERILGSTVEDAKSDLYSIQEPKYFDGTQPTREELLSIPLGESVCRDSVRTHAVTGEERYFVETTYHMTIEGIDRLVAVLSDRTEERNQRCALEEAVASAKAANEAKTVFLSNVSHDIRTPLNSIVGLAELMDKCAEDPGRVKQHAEQVKASSNHLLGLVNDVLDMSKIENGSTSLNLANFRLASVLDEVERVIGSQANVKGQNFVIYVDSDVPEAFIGDEQRISQVLMNILSNAVKYTDIGGNVSLDVRRIQAAGGSGDVAKLRFTIKDDGIGMSETFLNCIFDPFTRETDGIANEIQGTGLGMPIAKSLIDLMGGAISVESEQGKGSTFVADLPLRIQEPAEPVAEPRANVDISGMNFLVAEDVDINAEVLKELLGTRNATCDIAENGKVATEMFIGNPADTYDAVLMDVRMPVMDGYEATKVIRSFERSDASEIPIIAMTANAFTEDVSEALAAGMDAHLAKPATMAQLCATLGYVMSEKDAAAKR